MNKKKYYFESNYIEPRSDQELPMFDVDGNGNMAGMRIRGYAIIPIEKYEALSGANDNRSGCDASMA